MTNVDNCNCVRFVRRFVAVVLSMCPRRRVLAASACADAGDPALLRAGCRDC